MGYTFEINVWDNSEGGHYYWLQIHTGESLLQAMYYLWWAKRQGWKCIKLEWRPS